MRTSPTLRPSRSTASDIALLGNLSLSTHTMERLGLGTAHKVAPTRICTGRDDEYGKNRDSKYRRVSRAE